MIKLSNLVSNFSKRKKTDAKSKLLKLITTYRFFTNENFKWDNTNMNILHNITDCSKIPSTIDNIKALDDKYYYAYYNEIDKLIKNKSKYEVILTHISIIFTLMYLYNKFFQL